MNKISLTFSEKALSSMNTITFDCEVITPMFLAGADGATPEIRASSIKGALRFWWRAMHGNLDIDDLRKKETAVFGGGGATGRRSSISLRIKNVKNLDVSTGLPNGELTRVHYGAKSIDVDVLKYLAYGAYDRPFINTGQLFSVVFQHDKSIDTEKNIVLPFYLMSLFGGLGAKSRNGFGRFKINKIDGVDVDKINDSFQKIEKNIKTFINSIKPKHPEKDFTCFSSGFKLYKTKSSQKNWNKALSELGRVYLQARKRIDIPHKYDNRAYLATPIVQSRIGWQKKDRHAKQYFFCVNECSVESYDGWILFLPYRHYKDFSAYKSATATFNNELQKTLSVVI